MHKTKRLVIALLVSILCQAQSQKINPSKVDQKALAAIEKSIADQFTALRKSGGLRPLARIKNRPQLRQMVCTAAVNEAFSHWGAVFYETSNVSAPDTRLEEIAKFDASQQKSALVVTDSSVGTYRTGGMPKIERYAVAVWPSKKPNHYWIGVGLYWSAGWEWVDLHLTDDIYYRNEWKKEIAPECGGKGRPKSKTDNMSVTPARRVQLCVGTLGNANGAPAEANVEKLVNSLRTRGSGNAAEMSLEARAVEIPSTRRGTIEGCEYVLELGNEELRDSCSELAGNTTECRDRESQAQANSRPIASTTRYSVEVSLYQFGNEVPILHQTLTEIYSNNTIISKDVGIGSSSVAKRMKAVIQTAISQTNR